MTQQARNIAIIGAGPASLYGAEVLAQAGHHVVILNRDVKPGGLVEYGIYLNKYKMKSGLRKVFTRILARDNVHYFGNVVVGAQGHISLEQLRELGFDAIVVAVGAQGTKWLGLPGERGAQVYHAKDVVFHYNSLPPFSERPFPMGDHVAVVGFGNVALDIVHWLVGERQVARATLVARRGPVERACTSKELKLVSGAMDLEQIGAEVTSISENLREVGQDPDAALAELTAYKDEPLESPSDTKLQMRFLLSPLGVERDEDGHVTGLICERTRLTPPRAEGDAAGVQGTGAQEVVKCDAVVFAIGDSIEPGIGLPLEPKRGATFAVVPEPWAEQPDAARYMCYDPQTAQPIWDTFVVGWARRASDGLVGKARADAVRGCEEILAYLEGRFPTQPQPEPQAAAHVREQLLGALQRAGAKPVDLDAIARLEAAEAAEAKARQVPEFKFASNEVMLQIISG